jgi:hypothetical protein
MTTNIVLDTQIVALESLDIYRDGGSVSASFLGADGLEYCLFFGIGRWRTAEVAATYRSPVLKWFRPAEYRSPVTGDVSPVWTEDSHPIEWTEARRILDELSRFFAEFESPYRWVFDEMVEAAAENGR